MTLQNQPKFVIGIDFGTVNSGVTIAHVDDPSTKYTVLYWEETTKKPPPFLSSILYTPTGEIKCGVASLEVNDGVYISNISQYILDPERSNEKLEKMMNGLTIQKIVADFLKYFITLAHERLLVHTIFRKSLYFEEYALDGKVNLDNIRYCLVCPTAQKEFMKNCFIDTGIIEEHEGVDRLSFVTAAKATAHYQLSLGRNTSGIQNDTKYLVCDVGHISISIAKIVSDTTESLSTVEHVLDDSTLGSISLENTLRNHLEENNDDLNLNNVIIEDLVAQFVEKHKFSFDMSTPEVPALSVINADGEPVVFTFGDLNDIVFMPFINGVIDFILKIDEKTGECKLFLSGEYNTGFYFVESLTAKDNGKFFDHTTLIEDSRDILSSGAVSSILHTKKQQVPYLMDPTYNPVQDITENLNKTGLDDATTKSSGNEGYSYIVGIDFGTTYSGCSYVRLLDQKKKAVTERDITTIKDNWPGGNKIVYGKTPTLLILNDSKKVSSWGEQARLDVKQKKDQTLLGNFKLFLCPEALEQHYGGGNEEVAELQSRYQFDRFSATQIIASYLQVFKNHALDQIVKEIKSKKWFSITTKEKILKKLKIKYVITVPAMWDSQARDTMVEAAIQATIIKRSELDRLLVITEPEAAALFCEKKFSEYFENPEEGANFILCDAGGGTVDLVTFELTVSDKMNKEGNAIKESLICQIGDGSGDTCGSTYLDIRFKQYILQFYRDMGVQIDSATANLDDLMYNFQKNIKPHFMPDLNGDSSYRIELPGGHEITNYTGSNKYKLVEDNTVLLMKKEDMKIQVFDPIVDRIINLIDAQRKQAEIEKKPIGAILMVGGFSQSEYLQSRIKAQYHGICTVSVPPEGVTAVSHGAVSYALNPRMISKRSAGQSFGMEVLAPFEKKNRIDIFDKKVLESDGQYYAKNRLYYFVEKDQPIDGEKRIIYTKTVEVAYPNTAVIAIFSCDSKTNANSRFITDNHTKILERKITMPIIDSIKDGDLIQFDVSLQMEHISASVKVKCRNELINREIQRISNNKKTSLEIESKCDLNVVKVKKSLIEYSLAKTGYLFNIKESATV